MNTPNFENLEKYSLQLHGDDYERAWWPLLCKDFPEYETLWRRYIVPLTNRIDQSIPMTHYRWIEFRADIPEQFQRFAITHYSVFYYIARATERMNTTEYVFVEDVLFLLDSCADNIELFFDVTKQILGDFNREHSFLPKQFPRSDDTRKVLREISDYRNVVLHNPPLGRILRDGAEYLPLETELERVKTSWEAAWKLDQTKLIEKKVLLSNLRGGLIAYIRGKWATLTKELEHVRSAEKFSTVTHLEQFLPIILPPAVMLPQVPRASPQEQHIIVVSSNTFPPCERKRGG